MAKNPIPVRQDIETVTGGQRQNGQLSIGEVTSQLPAVPQFNAAFVVARLQNFNDQADRVLAAATRADITDDKAAATGTDFLNAISKQIAAVDEQRKDITGGFDKLVKGLNALFNTGPARKLAEAKTLMQRKLGAYATEKRRKAEEAAEAERQRIAAEAAAQSQTALDEGDEEGALEILEAAGEIEVEAERHAIRGASAALTGVRRKVGKVTDLRKFLAWVGADQSAMAVAMAKGVDVKQKDLNQLAATVLAANELAKKTGAPELDIPGFSAEFVESFNARG
jgi:hypothetical protein